MADSSYIRPLSGRPAGPGRDRPPAALRHSSSGLSVQAVFERALDRGVHRVQARQSQSLGVRKRRPGSAVRHLEPGTGSMVP